MRIKYTGSGRRVLGGYVWEEANGYVVDVDAETAANLLTYPRPGFVVAPDEPLLALEGADPENLAVLALAGVASVTELARLSKARQKRVAEETGLSPDGLQVWVEIARDLVGVGTDEAKGKPFVEIRDLESGGK